MADWKTLAAALAPDIPADQVNRVTEPLAALEAQFRPLLADLPLETEPAYVMLVHPEKQA